MCSRKNLSGCLQQSCNRSNLRKRSTAEIFTYVRRGARSGHSRLLRKKQFHELFAERLLDIGCWIGRARCVHKPDDGRVLRDGLNCHIEKLIYQSNRRCLGTHWDGLAQSSFSSWQYCVLIVRATTSLFGEKLVERPDRCSGACCNIAHRSRVISSALTRQLG